MVMYGIGTLWKFELKKGIWYTGEILEEDTDSIKIRTIKKEKIILYKNELIQALEQNEVRQ